MKIVQAFADGSAIGNPGPGGYGFIVMYGVVRRQDSAGFRLTTNNRMELLGVIRALEAMKEPCRVTMTTDSRYVVDGIARGWARKWQARGWKTSNSRPAQNVDLWQRLLALVSVHDVTFEWVQGHSGHPYNDLCDELANAAARANPTSIDQEYEQRSGHSGY